MRSTACRRTRERVRIAAKQDGVVSHEALPFWTGLRNGNNQSADDRGMVIDKIASVCNHPGHESHPKAL